MTVEAFGSVAIRQFTVHTETLLREGLGLGAAETREFTDFASARLLCQGEDAFDEVSSFLSITGLRDRWNAALGLSRSEALGEWIAPHVKGSALDLLCGSGGVGRALQRRDPAGAGTGVGAERGRGASVNCPNCGLLNPRRRSAVTVGTISRRGR